MLVTRWISYHDGSMELQQMRYVIAVAETNNFTRAAQRCLVVSPRSATRSRAWRTNWVRGSSELHQPPGAAHSGGCGLPARRPPVPGRGGASRRRSRGGRRGGARAPGGGADPHRRRGGHSHRPQGVPPAPPEGPDQPRCGSQQRARRTGEVGRDRGGLPRHPGHGPPPGRHGAGAGPGAAGRSGLPGPSPRRRELGRPAPAVVGGVRGPAGEDREDGPSPTWRSPPPASPERCPSR